MRHLEQFQAVPVIWRRETRGSSSGKKPDSSRFCVVLPDRAQGDMELFAPAPISLGSGRGHMGDR
jgi:hypothetical protein